MLKSRDGTRRLGLVVGIIAAAALFAASLAFASAPIIGRADNTYTAATYTIDQGEVAQLQVTGSSHNATARQNGPDAKALFRSPTISGGSTAVDGTQYLIAGDYTFFCTVHPTTMQATLHVSTNGAPQARPSASLTSKTKTISQALKKGIKVAANASTAVSGVAFTAKLGKATIGKATASLSAGAQTVTVRLTKAGKSRLRGKSKASVTVSADIPFGSPATAKTKLK